MLLNGGMPGIAVVGISVELPSGTYSNNNFDHNAFYEFLLNGGEAYESMPSDRLNVESWTGNGLGQIKGCHGSFLKDINMFDNVEFGVSSRDARAMAPATRKLIENSFLALRDSGIDYRMKNIGCFTSGTSIDLGTVTDVDEYEAKGSLAGSPSMLANRVSYHLDLLGASISIDTACSSTATALHLAVQAVTCNECEAAIVAGCQLNHRFMEWFSYSQASILAKDGRCKPFDSEADGFVRAEGCCAIVIKSLHDALRDHDRIYATILGTAINSTGASAPPNAPVGDAQREAMIQAFARAGRKPQEVDYIELHATGTAKGDPIEANWVGEEFQRDDDLLVGSVKGNIGHTEIVSLLASMSKVISTLQHGLIPPNINIRTLNPSIAWDRHRLHVPRSPICLPCRSGHRSLIAMASSGIGGTNAHVVLEGPPPLHSMGSAESLDVMTPVLLLAGGLSARSASSNASAIADMVADGRADLSVLSTVLGRTARQMTWRSYAIATPDADNSLQFSLPQYSLHASNSDPIVFVFSGQGPQHYDMGKHLFKAFPAFRDSILEMDAVFRNVTTTSVIEDYGLFGGNHHTDLGETWPISVILPSIAMFQIALFDLLISLGVKPNILIGHSAGETAILYASGAASKAMAVELAILRGVAFSSIESESGTMAALACGPEDAIALLDAVRAEGIPGTVEIACYNSPSAVAIAGHDSAVDAAVTFAQRRGVFARKIRTRVPIHSSIMELCRKQYVESLNDLFYRYPGAHVPIIPTYSTLTGRYFEGPYNAEYFWQATRFPVRFTNAIQAICGSASSTFVEIAPHPVLASYMSSMVDNESVVLSSIRRPKSGDILSEHHNLLELFGKLTAAGYKCVDFTRLNQRACYEAAVSLPPYPFVKKEFPLYPDTFGYEKQMAPHNGPLNHPYLRINCDTHPMVGEHIIRGEPIMPAAGFVEMALEYGATTLMNVSFRAMLSLSSEIPVKLSIHRDGAYWSIKSATSSGSSVNGKERLHADGYLSCEDPLPGEKLDIVAIRRRCPNFVGSSFYEELSYFSSYGPSLQRVTNAYYSYGEALVSIRGLDETLIEQNYILHPAILDACIHITAYKPFHGNHDPNGYYLPAEIGALYIHLPHQPSYFPKHIYEHVVVRGWTPTSMIYDMVLADDSGTRLCTLLGVKVARHRMQALREVSRPLMVVPQVVDRLLVQTHTGSALQIPSVLKSSSSVQTREYVESQLYANARVGFGPFTPQKAVSPMITQSALEMSHFGIQSCLEDMASDGRSRVVRMLLLTNLSHLPAVVAEVLNQYPSLFVEMHIVGNISREALRLQCHNCTVVSAWGLNDWMESLDEDTELFDLAIASYPVGAEQPKLDATIIRCVRHLRPHGILTLTVLDHVACIPGSTDSGGNNVHMPVVMAFTDIMKRVGLVVLFAQYDDTEHSSLVTLKCIKAFNPQPYLVSHNRKICHYRLGDEDHLQSDLREVDPSSESDVWILAEQGQHSASATGLARALRREYPLWSIHLIAFPSSFTTDMQHEALIQIPSHLKEEPEIMVSSDGILSVPRLLPLSHCDINGPSSARALIDIVPQGCVLVHVLSATSDGGVVGVVGSVIKDSTGTLEQDSCLVGLTDCLRGQRATLEVDALRPVSSRLAQCSASLSALLPGLLTAILAPGLSAFRQSTRLQSSSILLTHSDALVGSTVKRFYLSKGINFTEVISDISLRDLARLGHGRFDLIISGYEDKCSIQLAETLLHRTRGRLFAWHDERTGLPDFLHRDPLAIRDALELAMSFLETNPDFLCAEILNKEPLIPHVAQAPETIQRHVVFRADKSYLILGGIGSLGARIALLMYQRGARHVIVTSRRGEDGLSNNGDILARRIFEHLRSIEDFHLEVHAVDATSTVGMQALTRGLTAPLGGCMILTAVLADRAFQNLTREDYSGVFAAKLNVLSALRDTVDIASMDFLIAFSSVSGLFGVGGQTNYGAANMALEQAISLIPNAFSFVCPGILDSSMLLVGQANAQATIFSHFLEWSISAEEMIIWLEDALFRFQSGQRFVHYIPDLDWESLDRTFGMPKLGRHLVPMKVAQKISVEDNVDRLADTVRIVLNVSIADISPNTPLTTYGIDSLSAARLSYALRPILDISQLQLLADVSLNDLRHKMAASHHDTSLSVVGESFKAPSKDDEMRELLEKYIVTALEEPVLQEVASDRVVLLTGSTGGLGSHLLAELLGRNDIKRIYALNRKTRGEFGLRHRQRESLVFQGLSVDVLESPKLILIESDFDAEDLGLDEASMLNISSTVTHIIHNAWKLDFYAPLTEFEGLIRGTQALIKMALRSPHFQILSFISTIGVCQDSAVNPAPEAAILDAKAAVQNGYLESKWIAERLVQLAAQMTRLKTNVIRVGLLTGSASGSWDTRHWFPALVQSATYDVSWLTTPLAAAAIVDMCNVPNETLHIIHPRPVKWATIIEPLASRLKVPLVPYDEWFARLENIGISGLSASKPSGGRDREADDRIALRLLQFFRKGCDHVGSHTSHMESKGFLPPVQSQKGRTASPALSGSDVVQLSSHDVDRWVGTWKSIGFLPQ
ncbi:uncharacterized protein FIBRA_04328 [Fibroporia radiculosa]|uniref:Carrier domain-containing protein n=1 Tax=Fibroporia radiculosa TaxID=599839 RepID=J4HWH0_9APHY|nr:uncharacterized protein FIBRA_04328 [Fibroporia radiculosa]CCM02247.1 predicted protein [Fibroporia radiculosa]